MPSRRTVRALLVGVPLAVVAVAASLAVVIVARAQHQPGSYRSDQADYGHAPAYSLTDQLGRTTPSTEFAGKVQVVSYLFPYCRTYCPTITHTLVQLQRDLAQAGLFGGKVQFVIFNVDPAGAGPREMRAFLEQYGVDPATPGWHYLTGDPQQVRRVVHDGYHVYYSKVSLRQEAKDIARERAQGTYVEVPERPNALADHKHVGYDVVHNDYIEVVDPDGRISSYFDGNQVSEARLLQTVREATLAGG
ncbi:MAG: SCO family protein [Frankiaceae bacterium]